MNTFTPASSSSSASSLRSIVRSHRFSGIGRLTGLGIVLALFASSALPAATPDKSSPTPVTVVGPVDVQGSVETLNDALRIPYFQSGAFSFSRNGNPEGSVSFTIPAGKRLIIETISLLCLMPPGGYAPFIQLNSNLNAGVAPYLTLSATNSGMYNSYALFTATHAVRLRVDAPAAQDGTLHIFIGLGSALNYGDAFFNGSISGYLVNL